MRHLVGFLIGIALVGAACNKSKPTITGRLSGPTDLAEYKGCAQYVPACVGSEHHLLLIANSFSNDLRIFDVEDSNFFKAYEPLFPLSIPVGELPVSLAIDPTGRYAFVVNAVSQDISLVDLAADTLMEVSRVPLGTVGTDLQPEFVVVPQPDTWDTQTPLPVYVSLLGAGQIAVLNFQYPESNAGTPLLTLQTGTPLPVSGMPSGLTITKDGKKLFVANESSNSIQVIEIGDNNVIQGNNPIDIGSPSRRLTLTPDETKLYVVHTTSSYLSVVDVGADVGTETLCVSCTAGCEPPPCVDTSTVQLTIAPPAPGTIPSQNVPRSVTFVDMPNGPFLSINDKTYTLDPQGTAVHLFAYVSNLDGSVYVVDAQNHCAINKSTTCGDPLFETFTSSVLVGLAGEMISDNFKNTSVPNAKDDFRIYLLFEGSNALMEFFPGKLSSTNYLLYQ